MGDFTHADRKRIEHRLDASQRRRKAAEIYFTAGMLIWLAGMAGYFLGSFYPYQRSVPDFAKKVGEAREHATTTAPRRK